MALTINFLRKENTINGRKKGLSKEAQRKAPYAA